ncbi:hypothetical protein EYC95_12175 [Pseudomonas sp. BGI-2]|nr:hypothetical protein EYC95_12175 [Pseudomonas sp. BGI-2]
MSASVALEGRTDKLGMHRKYLRGCLFDLGLLEGLFAGKPRSYRSCAIFAKHTKSVGARLAREGVGSVNTNQSVNYWTTGRRARISTCG